MKKRWWMAIAIIFALSLLHNNLGITAFGHGAFVYGSHVNQSSQTPQINLVCYDKPLNIPSDPSKWDQAFTNTQHPEMVYKSKLIIDNTVTDYKYAGSDKYSTVRIMCDPNKYYFLGEYVIPSDSGSIKYKPEGFTVYIDTTNHKNSVPQKEDYSFDVNHGLYGYRRGIGDPNAGYNGWDSVEGTKILDNGFGKGAFSMLSTTTFSQLHPSYYLELLKSDPNHHFSIQNPFGVAFWLLDGNIISKQGGGWTAYNTWWPANMDWTRPYTWADAYSSYQSQITATSQLSTTSQITMQSSLSSQMLISSKFLVSSSSEVVTTQTGPILSIGFQGLEWLVAIPVILAVAALLGMRRYRQFRK